MDSSCSLSMILFSILETEKKNWDLYYLQFCFIILETFTRDNHILKVYMSWFSYPHYDILLDFHSYFIFILLLIFEFWLVLVGYKANIITPIFGSWQIILLFIIFVVFLLYCFEFLIAYCCHKICCYLLFWYMSWPTYRWIIKGVIITYVFKLRL